MRQLTYRVTVEWTDFEFWSGAVDTVDFLIEHNLMTEAWDYYCEQCDELCQEPTETEVNDYFWFETDYIAEALGYSDYESMCEELKGDIENDD